MEKIIWIGPDCINPTGITKDHLHLLTNLDQVLKFSPQEIVTKENAFFLSLFKEIEEKKDKKEANSKSKQNNSREAHINSNEIHIFDKKSNQIILENDHEKKILDENKPMPSNISKFPEKSFAILKAKNWKYNIKKLQIIIGRNSLHKDCQSQIFFFNKIKINEKY